MSSTIQNLRLPLWKMGACPLFCKVTVSIKLSGEQSARVQGKCSENDSYCSSSSQSTPHRDSGVPLISARLTVVLWSVRSVYTKVPWGLSLERALLACWSPSLRKVEGWARVPTPAPGALRWSTVGVRMHPHAAVVLCHVGDAESDGQPRAAQPGREGHDLSCPTCSSPGVATDCAFTAVSPWKLVTTPHLSPQGSAWALFSFCKVTQFPFPYLAPSSLYREGSQPPTLALHLFLMVNSQKYSLLCISLNVSSQGKLLIQLRPRHWLQSLHSLNFNPY